MNQQAQTEPMQPATTPELSFEQKKARLKNAVEILKDSKKLEETLSSVINNKPVIQERLGDLKPEHKVDIRNRLKRRCTENITSLIEELTKQGKTAEVEELKGMLNELEQISCPPFIKEKYSLQDSLSKEMNQPLQASALMGITRK